MTTTGPFYTFDNRKRWTIASVAFWCAAIFGLFALVFFNLPLTVTGGHLFSAGYPVALAFIFAFFSTLRTKAIARRIAFYDGHLTIEGLFDQKRVVDYSHIDLKPPLTYGRKGRPSKFGIRIAVQSGDWRSSQWIYIANAKINAPDPSTLFDLVGGRTQDK